MRSILILLVWLTTVFYVVALVLAVRYHRRRGWAAPPGESSQLRASLIVPAFNEEPGLRNCVAGLLGQTHSNLEIVIVDDGSTDGTLEVARAIESEHPGIVRVTSQPNGGKARALNTGVSMSTGDVVVCVDGDSVLEPDAVALLLETFADPAVVAVGGNVRVANRRSLWGGQQAIEYVTGFAVLRAAFAELGAMTVISGALGAFRREALLAAGGYSSDTIVEDMDITIAMHEHGKIMYNPDAVAWTEAPVSGRQIIQQRHRWVTGGFQTLGKYRGKMFRPSAGMLGMVGLPYFLVGPWLSVLMSTLIVLSLLFAGTVGGALAVLALALAISVGPFLLALVVSTVDRQPRWLSGWGALGSVLLYQFNAFITVRAGVHFVAGRQAEWKKLKRLGANVVPADGGARREATV